jgi:hypothetical protein
MGDDADADADADEGDGGIFGRDALLLGTVLLVGVAGTGIVRRLLGEAGLNDLGAVVWVLGYGGTVLVVWYGWIRPLDIGGPSRGLAEVEETEGGGEETQP